MCKAKGCFRSETSAIHKFYKYCAKCGKSFGRSTAAGRGKHPVWSGWVAAIYPRRYIDHHEFVREAVEFIPGSTYMLEGVTYD